MTPIPIQTPRLKRIYRPISLDITPAIAAGQQLIQSYGDGRFRIAGEIYKGSVLVTRETTARWGVTSVVDITFENLEAIIMSVSNGWLQAPRVEHSIFF